jgi:hypothetical protein
LFLACKVRGKCFFLYFKILDNLKEEISRAYGKKTPCVTDYAGAQIVNFFMGDSTRRVRDDVPEPFQLKNRQYPNKQKTIKITLTIKMKPANLFFSSTARAEICGLR